MSRSYKARIKTRRYQCNCWWCGGESYAWYKREKEHDPFLEDLRNAREGDEPVSVEEEAINDPDPHLQRSEYVARKRK